MSARPLVTTRHASQLGSWEMVSGAPHAALSDGVLGYTGYRESTPSPLARREVPGGRLPLILSFERPLRVLDAANPQRAGATVTSFVAGLHDAPTVTEHAGEQHGVEVSLTPIAAYALFRVPMHELSNRVVELSDLLGREANALVAELAEAPGWSERFALIDRALGARLRGGRAVPAEIAWAWRRLRDSGGTVPVSELVAQTGLTQRALIERFREHIGLRPKRVAQLFRFERARALLLAAPHRGVADIAARCGYYDQAHLNLDFRRFAGCTPREHVAAQRPDGGGHEAHGKAPSRVA